MVQYGPTDLVCDQSAGRFHFLSYSILSGCIEISTSVPIVLSLSFMCFVASSNHLVAFICSATSFTTTVRSVHKVLLLFPLTETEHLTYLDLFWSGIIFLAWPLSSQLSPPLRNPLKWISGRNAPFINGQGTMPSLTVVSQNATLTRLSKRSLMSCSWFCQVTSSMDLCRHHYIGEWSPSCIPLPAFIQPLGHHYSHWWDTILPTDTAIGNNICHWNQ